MFIKVINWCSHTILAKDNEPVFYLERDNWDDNYFKTRYHLHLSGNHTEDGEALWIGEVKILRKGQRRNDGALLEPGNLDYLGYRFCSIGQSLDYYERIARLDSAIRYQVLSALRDIVIYPTLMNDFEGEDGMNASLLHYLSKEDDLFALGPAIVSGDFSKLPVPDISFTFQAPQLAEALPFRFESPLHGYREPTDRDTRVSVISSGTDNYGTSLLCNLALVSYASNEERDLVQETGTIFPSGTAFTKIICLSYRSVPGFRVPGIYLHEKEQIARETAAGRGRFIYLGSHDLTRELEDALQYYTIDTDGRVWEHDNPSGEPPTVHLKPSEELSAEFAKAIGRIEQDLNKQDLWDNVMEILQSHEELRFTGEIKLETLRDDELESFFLNLNSGQQILFHALANLVIQVSPRSLLLSDGPEDCMPPTLIPALVKSLSYILERENAFMIVATTATDYFSDTPGKNISVSDPVKEYQRNETPRTEKNDHSDAAIFPHILGLPNETFPPSL